MKRVLIAIAALLALLGLGLFTTISAYSKPLPEAVSGPEAEALAKAIQAGVNLKAWEETGAVTWVFRGSNTHLWDRQRNLAQVEWGGDTKVLVDLGKQVGRAYVKGEEIQGAKKDKLVKKAYEAWINDSFWLNPIAKFYDDGVSRGLTQWEGGDALMISYASGGVTPGDSYLYIPGAEMRPAAWHMWVSIIPLKGVKTTWEGWTALSTGAYVSTHHELGPLTIDLTQVKGAPTLEALVGTEDPFAPLIQ